MRVKTLLACLAAILASGPAASTEQSKCVKCVREIGTAKVHVPGPVSYVDAYLACSDYGKMQLVDSVAGLSAIEKKLCDDLVPLNQQLTLGVNPKTVFAANLTSGKRFKVGKNRKFSCVLCRHADVTFPLRTSGIMASIINGSGQLMVHLTSVDTRDSAAVDELEKTALVEEVGKVLMPFGRIEFRQSWLDDSRHLHLDFPTEATVDMGNGSTSLLNGKYVMSLEDVGWCPAGEAVDTNGVVTQWPATKSFDEFRFSSNLPTGVITRRDCRFNKKTYHAEWDPLLTRWQLVWRPCSSDELYVNEEYYKQFLDAVDIDTRHANALQELASTPVNAKQFKQVASLVDRELTSRNEMYEQTAQYLVNITAQLVMDSGSDNCVAKTGRAGLIVADLGGNEPVVGFTVRRTNPRRDSDVTVNRKATEGADGKLEFALDVSRRLSEAHSRMAFVVAWGTSDSLAKGINFVEVTVMFPRKGEVSEWAFASYGNHHVDITYNPKLLSLLFYDQQLFCVAWSNDLREWSKEGCKTVVELVSSSCRCSGKYFALQDGVPIAKYALKIA